MSTVASRLLERLQNLIVGGKGDTTNPKSFDPQDLKIGTTVEREHTGNTRLAREIATDHLTEDPKYYRKLYKARLIDEPRARKLLKG